MRGLSLVAATGGHSSSRCKGLSLSRPPLLQSTGSRCAGSAIVAQGPSHSAARGIFPDQGSNPCPLHWQADSQPLRHQGSPCSLFFIPAILIGVYQNHIAVLICISLMVNKAEHLFMCLLAICIFSSMKCLFTSFVHLVTRLIFLLLSFESSLYIIDSGPSPKVFSKVYSLFFHPFNRMFCREKDFLKICDEIQFIIFFLR